MKDKLKTSYYIESFLNYISSVEKSFPFMELEMEKKNDETQDILHEIELGNTTYKERAKIATRLRNVRKERRVVKDYLEEISALVQWVDENKSCLNKLKEVLGQVRKQEKYHQNRTYHKRVNS